MTPTKPDHAPTPDHVLYLDLGPRLRLFARVRERESFVDLRLGRCASGASPDDPASWSLTTAGFRLPATHIAELRAVLRELLPVLRGCLPPVER